MILFADSKGLTALMHRLIWVFTVCICPKSHFCMTQPMLSFYTLPQIVVGIMVPRWTSVCHPSIRCPSSHCLSVRISFLNDNLSKHQPIFTKLGMYIDIVEVWFGIANRHISSNFEELSAQGIFSFPDDNFS